MGGKWDEMGWDKDGDELVCGWGDKSGVGVGVVRVVGVLGWGLDYNT